MGKKNKMNPVVWSIIISVFTLILSALLSYLVTRETFKKEQISLKANNIYDKLGNLINTSERFGALLNTIITQKYNIPENKFNLAKKEKIFKDNEKSIYEEIIEHNILNDIKKDIEDLEYSGFEKICLEANADVKNKFSSLYITIISNKKSSNEKIKEFHIIMYNYKLLDDLRKMNIEEIQEKVKNYMK